MAAGPTDRPPPPIQLEVRHAATGERLELEVACQSTLYSVKCAVAEAWQVPPLCQVLTLGGEVLDDARALLLDFQSLPDGAPLPLVLEESYGDLEAALGQDNPLDTRVLALQVLVQLARGDRPRAVSLGERRLEDAHPEARRAALEVVASSAPPGDEQAMQMLTARLKDPEEGVRLLAAESLARVAGGGRPGGAQEPGDPRRLALEAAGELLAHWRGDVRRAAIVALAQLVRKGDDFLIEALCGCLTSEDAEVAESALEVLLLVCTPEGKPVPHRDATEKLVGVLREARVAGGCAAPHMARARCLAMRALTQVARPGEPAAVSELLAGARDSSVAVRAAAVETLARLAPPGHLEALAVLFGLLGRPAPARPVPKPEPEEPKPEAKPARRRSSARAGGQAPPEERRSAAGGGGEGAVHGAGGGQPPEAGGAAAGSKEAAAAPAGLTRANDVEAAELMADEMRPKGPADEDWTVRRAAVAALAELGGDMHTVRAVGERLMDPAHGVQLAAREALPLLARKAAPRGVPFCAALCARLCAAHARAGVRLLAAGVLAEVAPRGDPGAVAALAALASAPRQCAEARSAAASALAVVASRGDAAAMSALVGCLEDGRAEVRLGAVRALPAVAAVWDEGLALAIAERLKDRDAGVRAAAAAALAARGGEPVVGAPRAVCPRAPVELRACAASLAEEAEAAAAGAGSPRA